MVLIVCIDNCFQFFIDHLSAVFNHDDLFAFHFFRYVLNFRDVFPSSCPVQTLFDPYQDCRFPAGWFFNFYCDAIYSNLPNCS